MKNETPVESAFPTLMKVIFGSARPPGGSRLRQHCKRPARRSGPTTYVRFLFAPLVVVLSPVALLAADRDWPAYLGDAGATHYSTLRQIDRANVARLTPAWTFRTGDATSN